MNLIFSHHARNMQAERGISDEAICFTMQYGQFQQFNNGRAKFKLGHIVVIANTNDNVVITAYKDSTLNKKRKFKKALTDKKRVKRKFSWTRDYR